MIPKKNIPRAIKKALAQPEYAFSNLFHRVIASIYYHLYDGISYAPETVSLFLTYKCNLRCFMCGQWGEEGIFKSYSPSTLKDLISLDDVGALVRELKRYKTNFTLFGGEPMLHPHWLEIVHLIKKNGLRCNIVTNGTFVGKYAKAIINSKLDEIIFSLDGPEEIHDKIRRVPNTFNRTINGFKKLKALKEQKKTKRPLVNINTTINELNYKYLEEIIEIARDIGAKMITFHHLLFLKTEIVENFIKFFQKKFGETPYDWLGFGRKTPPEINVNLLISEIEEIKKKNYDIEVSFFPNLSPEEVTKWYTEFDFNSKNYKNRCMSLWMTAYVFPDGVVRPYHTMNYNMGNIREKGFKRIWNSPKYVRYRAYIKEHKRFPVCSKGCTEFFRY